MNNEMDGRDISHEDAKKILDDLREKLKQTPNIKKMPQAKPSRIDIYADIREDYGDHDRY